MKIVRAFVTVSAFLLALGTVGTASADCPPSCPLTGGGDETTDCHSELASTAMSLNSPFFNPIKMKPAKEHRCFDGDPGCDLDGTANGACEFDIDVCFRNADPALPSCTPADVTAFDVKGEKKFAGLLALETAGGALLPATSNVCTSGQSVTLALKSTSKGLLKRSKMKLSTSTTTATGIDKDKVKLSCVPTRWAKHGFDHRNTRNNPLETKLTPANAAGLVQKWQFHLSDSLSSAVTSTPTVGRKLIYITSWDGKLYALDRKNGKEKWSYDTQSINPGYDIDGVQTSATLTADGRLLVGDANADVHCLDAKKGTLLWKSSIGDPDETTGDGAHAWASATVANNRVFVGRASHLDTPCTQGGIYAFDLDSGADLWHFNTVPDNICTDDTNIECTTNADCGGGTCIPGLGGGVTAAATTSDDGETVFLSVIGCYTYPSIGNSDAIISLDAATGAMNWAFRTRTVEQFTGAPYHDYGFINGPILMDIPDGGGTQRVVVAGSKDGTLYAVDATTGTEVWTREVQPATDFVYYGLFNAAMGAADGRIYATLYDLEDFPTTPESLDRLHAFDAETGATDWSAQTDRFSWSDVGLAGGLLFAGDKTIPGTGEFPAFNVYNAATGALLRSLGPLDGIQSPAVGGPVVVDGTLYVPYGLNGQGGVTAFEVPD
jgi:outer membrane protein assembly factor BamB